MSGELSLKLLIESLNPLLALESFVFCCVSEQELVDFPAADITVMVREAEGITLVLSAEVAARHGFSTEAQFACITLQVHSSLQAVGLTAVVASQLAGQGISANVVAGYYHDHIYVAEADGERAVEMLRGLTPDAIDRFLGDGF